VVFDLDGTLVDAFGDIHAALNKALAENALPPRDMQAVRGFVGNGLPRLCERAAGPGNEELVPALVAATKRHYAADPVARSRMYPMTREMLLDLRRLKVATAVLTNKDEDLARLVAKGLGFERLLDALRGARPGEALKPDPAALLALRDELHAAEVFMVGDGDPDWQVAEAAGARFIGVAWGQLPVGALEQHGPVARSAGEIVRLVQQIASAEI
jgi:phosphoglycolate phosphatase